MIWLMIQGSEAVTTVSVQRRSRLRLGGDGLRLAGTTGEKQGKEDDCEILKWLEFLHAASVSNGRATTFLPSYGPSSDAICCFENETEQFHFWE